MSKTFNLTVGADLKTGRAGEYWQQELEKQVRLTGADIKYVGNRFTNLDDDYEVTVADDEHEAAVLAVLNRYDCSFTAW